MMKTKTRYFKEIIKGIVVGAIVGVSMMYIAWQHNMQGEIHQVQNIEWGYWLSIGLFWALVVGVPLTIILIIIQKWVGTQADKGK